MTLQLRPYQQGVVDQIGKKNVIVKMPTGSGKTFIAAECMRKHLNTGILQKKCLFLVPTCDLVSQQAKAIHEWSGNRVSTYMGSLCAPPSDTFDIMVSTPESFRCLQMRDKTYDWRLFQLCIFDEVHHVLKDHPYRKLAYGIRSYMERQSRNGEKVQIIGLSASLTYAVGKKQVQKALQNLSRDLMLEEMINVTDQELREGGYDPPSLDGLEILREHVLPDGIVPSKERKPHLMHSTFFERAKRHQCTKFSNFIFHIVKQLEYHAMSLKLNFDSPIKNKSLSSWEDYAHKLACRFPSHILFLNILESWYIALRILVQTWEEEEELVLNWLKINRSFDAKQFLLNETNEIDYIKKLSQNPSKFSKVGCLKAQLLEKKKMFGPSFRAIVFVQQRIAAHIICHYINNDKCLSEAKISSDYVAARNAKITPKIKITSSASKACIDKFREGSLNVIVATSVIEEGFDVPDSNVVISFDHIKDTVELAQRFGRARQSVRSIVIMDERDDRPIQFLKDAAKSQDSHMAGFCPQDSKIDIHALKQAQINREIIARSVLFSSVNKTNALRVLNEYIKKTKADEDKNYYKVKLTNEWVFKFTYTSILRTVSSEGRGQSKKEAQQVCALELLERIRSQVHKV